MSKRKSLFVNSVNTHTSRTGDGAYYNSEQVKNNVSRYARLSQSIQDSSSDLYKMISNELKELKDTLLQHEKSFYALFNLQSSSRNQAIQKIQKRLDEWKNSGADILLSPAFSETVYKILAPAIDMEKFSEAITLLVQNEYREQLINEPIQDPQKTIAQMVNIALNKKSGSKGSYSNVQNQGLNAAFAVVYEKDTFKVTPKDSRQLSVHLAQKIVKDLRTSGQEFIPEFEFKDWKNDVNNEIRMAIYNEISPKISNSSVLEYIKYELFDRAADSYNIWANSYTLIGALAEIYWNACLSFYLGAKGGSSTVGTKLNIRDKQLSVDILIKQCGFQVKNWSLADDRTYKLTYRRQLGNFLDTRTCLLQDQIGSIIARMFGSASYNLPNPDYVNEVGYEDYRAFYIRELSRRPTDSDISNLTKVFQARINKIIEIDNGGEIIDENGMKQTYLNTFWLIKDTIVPSSVIIERLLKELTRPLAAASIVEFHIDSLEERGESRFWPDELNTTDLVMANRWVLNYSVTFNLQQWIIDTISEENSR